LNRNHKFGIVAGIAAALLISIPVYLFSTQMRIVEIGNNNERQNGTSLGGLTFSTGTHIIVDVGGTAREGLAQTGTGTILPTRYLPVNITHIFNLIQPTKNITLYTVNADWDGLVLPDNNMRSFMYNKYNKPVSFTGFSDTTLYSLFATCSEPYFVKVLGTDLGADGIKLVNTTAPVQSSIYWGAPTQISFDETQQGTIRYLQTGYGIVPADYNNNNNGITYRNNGAGNKVISGTYHLSFTSFYQATINLPSEDNLTSFHKISCSVNEDSSSSFIQKSQFPHIYVYDVWFVIPTNR